MSDPGIVESLNGRGLVQVAGGIKVFDSLDLPATPNTCAARGSRVAAWLAPGRWLLIGSAEDAERWASVEIPGAAITDVSHGRSIARVSGHQWRGLLSHGCSLDFETSFTPGRWSCAQSVFSEVPVFMLVPPDGHWIEVHAPLSYRTFFWDMMTACAAPQGYRIARPDDPLPTTPALEADSLPIEPNTWRHREAAHR